MAREEEDRPAPKPRHQIGEPLDAISVDELRQRILLLEGEIGRLGAEIDRKQASRSAADAVFKR